MTQSVPKQMKPAMSRSYSNRTLKVLWGRAAGRCAMPECRMELIVDATEYDPIVVIGDIAHGAASSDGGPRADPQLTNKQRNDYGNLILLCQNCHARFDGQPNTYSEERWRDIKAAQEAWVRASLPERGNPEPGGQLLGSGAITPLIWRLRTRHFRRISLPVRLSGSRCRRTHRTGRLLMRRSPDGRRNCWQKETPSTDALRCFRWRQ